MSGNDRCAVLADGAILCGAPTPKHRATTKTGSVTCPACRAKLDARRNNPPRRRTQGVTHMNAAQLMHLANAVRPSLIILTRKQGPKDAPELNAPAPVNTYHEASELLAKWAETAPEPGDWSYGGREPDRVEVELFWGPAMGSKGEESVNLVVPLKRCHAESGYDLRLHLKRFAASMGALESAAKREG